MFLHLGEDVIVLKTSIIGIFDKDICTSAISTREFLEINESEKKIQKIGHPKKAKTFILTKDRVYLSPISSNTLVKRFEKHDNLY